MFCRDKSGIPDAAIELYRIRDFVIAVTETLLIAGVPGTKGKRRTIEKMSHCHLQLSSWLTGPLVVVVVIIMMRARVARFFLAQYTKARENIPNKHNVTK
jgi:hypothetical protein